MRINGLSTSVCMLYVDDSLYDSLSMICLDLSLSLSLSVLNFLELRVLSWTTSLASYFIRTCGPFITGKYTSINGSLQTHFALCHTSQKNLLRSLEDFKSCNGCHDHCIMTIKHQLGVNISNRQGRSFIEPLSCTTPFVFSCLGQGKQRRLARPF